MSATETSPATITESKPAPAFGSHVSPHMFVGHYTNGQWQVPEIMPYQNISIAPTNLALHYGQSVFEGMKAFRMKDGNVSVFRMEKHHERFNRTMERMCIPPLPFDYFANGIKDLIAIDASNVPDEKGSSLYIRPFVFATDETFGVKISNNYSFIIFTGPVAALYARPVKVKVETEYTRAAEGGTGAVKCAGNYAAALYPTLLANQNGYDQLLWTDSKNHEFIEESGTMNVMFVINDILVTPSLSGTILDGVTRSSFIQVALDLGYKVQQRKISYHELIAASADGSLKEAFGVGTAAVTSSIAVINILGKDYTLPATSENSMSIKIKEHLAAIKSGEIADTHGWNTVVPSRS